MRTAGRPPSALSKLSPSIAKAVPGGKLPATPAARSAKAPTIESWHLEHPALGLPHVADPWQRDRDALLALGVQAVGEAQTISLATRGLRAFLAKGRWAQLQWAAVLLAASGLTDDEVVKLVSLYMPAPALAVLARDKRWTAAKLRDLANRTTYAWKKVQLEPHVSATFADAAKLLQKRKAHRTDPRDVPVRPPGLSGAAARSGSARRAPRSRARPPTRP